MTSEELQEIRQRYNETTDTEWKTCCIGKDDPQFPPHVVCDLHPVGGLDLPATDEDAVFMAAAHADIPRLLDEVERLKEKLKLVRTIFTHGDDGIVMKAWVEGRGKFGGED